MTAVSTATYFCTSSPSESGLWARRRGGKRGTSVRARAIGRISCSGGGLLVNREPHHHPCREMLGNVAVRHPATGIRRIEQNIHRATRGHQHSVLPGLVPSRLTIDREDQKALPVKVDRVLHGVDAPPL